MSMEYRRLGRSGLMVPALSLGTGTFGGVGRLAAWGTTDATEARRLLDICLEAGVSMFDTADVYSLGESERVLGEAIKGRRDKVLVSTKATSASATVPTTSARRGSTCLRPSTVR
jgi:aryl-alcohol dehydrogenase-like predicted oxidoreductase